MRIDEAHQRIAGTGHRSIDEDESTHRQIDRATDRASMDQSGLMHAVRIPRLTGWMRIPMTPLTGQGSLG
jgi:hypothetical protein